MFRAPVLSHTLLVGFGIWTAVALESPWNQGARDHILNIHNNYRKNEGGCQIDKMQYGQSCKTHLIGSEQLATS